MSPIVEQFGTRTIETGAQLISLFYYMGMLTYAPRSPDRPYPELVIPNRAIRELLRDNLGVSRQNRNNIAVKKGSPRRPAAKRGATRRA